MSERVDLDRLRDEVGRFGTTPYLITVSDDGRPHAVSVAVAWDEGTDTLAARTGQSTMANASARPEVSLLWPPFEPGGFSLIVDGTAIAVADGIGPRVAVRPTHAVLHRSVAPSDPTDGYDSACAPVL